MSAAAAPSARWDERREYRSAALLRVTAWLALRLGPTAELLLPPIATWFLIVSPASRAASRDYLGRVLGRPARLADVYRHFFTFAATILDRVRLAAGRDAGFCVSLENTALLHAALEQGAGCLLLGAHMGNFDVLRIAGRGAALRVRPVMLPGHSGQLMRFLMALDPGLEAGVIGLGTPESMLRVRDGLAAGDVVGLLADRTLRGQRQVPVPFLGAEAGFPTGPLQLAASLGVPVLLFRAVRRGTRRYHASFEPFDARPLPGERPTGALRRYVLRLEAWCREDPLNWFNFFPFWA